MFTFEKQLNVRDSEVYDLLLDSMAYEASQKTGKQYEVKDILKGFRYNYKRKSGNKEYTAYVEVKKPSMEKIETIYEMASQKYVFYYSIKKLDEDRCLVFYSQDGGKSGPIADFFLKREMKKRFASFEKTILQRRNQKKD